jgi:phage terminase large subunit-like protein
MDDRLKNVLSYRFQNEKCRFFTPNGKQEEFIKAVGNGDHFIVVFSAANGVGKTAAAINILANLCWGPQNEFFNYPLFRNFPYPKRIRIGTESKNLEEIGAIDQEIKTWWPKGRYEAQKGGKLYLSQYKTDTGWVLDKMSYEQETREWESATLGVALLDEPPPKEKFAATVSRMRNGGIIIISMTPLSNAAWIMDDIVDSHNQDAAVIYADIESNCKEHGKNGTLDHVNIKKMIDNMDPDEVDARAYGKAMHLSSVILGKSFNRKHHVIDNAVKPPTGSQWFTVVDPARGKPWAIATGWVDVRGQIVFDDEYPKEDWLKIKETKLALNDYADILRVMEAAHPPEWRIIDRHFANARGDYQTTLKIDLEEKFNLDFINSYNCEKEVETGIQKVKDMLSFNDRMPIDSLNFPRLLIKEQCRNIIRSLERWDRDDTLNPRSNSPYKDHFDLVRYVAMAGLSVEFGGPPLSIDHQKRYVIGRG